MGLSQRQTQQELYEMTARYDNLLKVYLVSKGNEEKLNAQVESLRKVCEYLSNSNAGLLEDLTTTAMSRQRALNQLPNEARWKEQTLTSFEKPPAKNNEVL